MKKSPHLKTTDALRHVGQVDVREQVRSFVSKTEDVVQQHASTLAAYTRYTGDESFCNLRLRSGNRHS